MWFPSGDYQKSTTLREECLYNSMHAFLPFLPLFGGLRAHPLQEPVDGALADANLTGDGGQALSSLVQAADLLGGDG